MTTTAAAIRRDGAASKMLLGIYLVLVFFVMLLSPVSDTGSDSYGELLVSQVILHDHTVQLDRYKDYFRLADGRMHHAIVESGGHLYDLFPLGTSIVSLPAVAAANAAGIDVREADRALQKLLAAFASVVLALLLYAIAREFFSPSASLFWSGLMIFGTIIGPTVGTALWSLDYELIFAALTLLYLIRRERGERTYPAWLLGLVLFLGYLCRPTMAPLIALALGYLCWRDRRAGLTAAIASGALLALFCLWSYATFGSLQPPYYDGNRLSLSILPEALWGSLASPSRSLLVFNPILLVIPFALMLHRRPSAVLRLLWIAILLNFLTIITFPHWWVGHSFGPRSASDMVLLADIAVIMCCGLAANDEKRRLVVAAAQIALGLGFLINIQGLYNPYANYWSAYPDLEVTPQPILFDWRFPQFFMSEDLLRKKYETQTRELHLPDDQLLPIRGTGLLTSFSGAPKQSHVKFRIGKIPAARFDFVVVALSWGHPRLSVSLNGHLLGETNGKTIFTTALEASPDMLKANTINDLTITNVPADHGVAAFLSYRLR